MPVWLDMAPRSDTKDPVRLQPAARVPHARCVEVARGTGEGEAMGARSAILGGWAGLVKWR